MLEFRAIGLEDNTCFYLKKSGDEKSFKILVDVGRCTVKDIVKNIGTPAVIDLLICTHWHADHADGIPTILGSNQITVRNIWLPLSIVEDERSRLVCKRVEDAIKDYTGEVAVTRLEFHKGLASQGTNSVWRGGYNDFRIIGLNCKPATRENSLIIDRNVNLNTECFVFLFDDETKILFTGDSNLKYMKLERTSKIYRWINESTLITAPHHASKGSGRIYKYINEESYFVRTPNSEINKLSHICKKYLDLKNIYCTNCIDMTARTTVKLEFVNGAWKPNCDNCNCR